MFRGAAEALARAWGLENCPWGPVYIFCTCPRGLRLFSGANFSRSSLQIPAGIGLRLGVLLPSSVSVPCLFQYKLCSSCLCRRRAFFCHPDLLPVAVHVDYCGVLAWNWSLN